MSMWLCQEDQFLTLFYTFWTSIKSWLSESWVSSSWGELPELSELPFSQNLTHPPLKKSVSLMMWESSKSLLKRLSFSKDQLKTANYPLSFWEEAPETFSKIYKEPLMMESMFTNLWLENLFLFQVLVVLKFFCQKNLRLKPRSWLDLTSTVTADSPRLLKFSPEFWLRTAELTQTKWFQSWLLRTNKSQLGWTFWSATSRRFQPCKSTTTERQKNGPSDLLLKLQSPS